MPVAVRRLTSGATAPAAGGSHPCAPTTAALPPTRTAPAAARLLSFVDRLGGILVESPTGRRALGAATPAAFACSIPSRVAAARIGRVAAVSNPPGSRVGRRTRSADEM